MAQTVVVMGVSGCGKSALATGVAGQLGWRAVDADDLHAPEAVARMRAGQALDDADRLPWLDRVGAVLAEAAGHRQGLLVACSALRRAYRDRLRAACPGLRFVFLHGSRALIAERLARRRGHYMPASLLDSQWRTLECPGADEADVWQVDIAPPLTALVQQVAAMLRLGTTGGGRTPLEPDA